VTGWLEIEASNVDVPTTHLFGCDDLIDGGCIRRGLICVRRRGVSNQGGVIVDGMVLL